MYVGIDFDPTDGSEIEYYTLNFINDLVAGEMITQATWSIAVVTGTDPSAASRISGTAEIDPTGTMTSQQFANLLNTVKYRLTANVLTNFGNSKSLWSHAPGIVPD
jgi:hypothetical protein